MFNFSRIHGCFKLMIPGFDLFLVRNKNKIADNVIFDKTISLSFGLEECEELSSYKRSLVNSDMEWTDNIYKQLRVLNFQQNVELAVGNNPLGDFVELGVWKGLSADIMIDKLMKLNIHPRVILADSFEGGLSEKSDQDLNLRSVQTKKEIGDEKNQFFSTQSHVEKVTSRYINKEIIPGWLPQSIYGLQFPNGISFIHFDLDLYSPTLECFDFLWGFVVSGGVITFDDYDSAQFPGVTRAVDEVYAKYRDEIYIFYKVPFGSAFMVKY